MRLTISIFSIILLFSSCSKNDPKQDSGKLWIPWEFDITIGSYRSHFKAVKDNISLTYNNCDFRQVRELPGKMSLSAKGSSKLDPDFVSGDILTAGWIFPEGVGIKYPNKELGASIQFLVNDNVFVLGRIFSTDTSFQINIIDLGEPWIYDVTTNKYSNGKTGFAEIPKQTIKCSMYKSNPFGVPFDTTLEVSGTFTFGWVKGI